MSLRAVRCGKCAALLLKARPRAIADIIEIKCRRCGHLNILRPEEPAPQRAKRIGERETCNKSQEKRDAERCGSSDPTGCSAETRRASRTSKDCSKERRRT